jgi:hypothetical protein
MLGSSRNLQECRGAGLEEQAIEEALILIGEGRQLVREGEDHLYVAGGQEFLSARLQPAVAGLGLTLGAVPISAGNGELSITCLMGSSF